MKSWKTSLTGALTIITALSSAITAMIDNDPATMPDWTLVIAAITSGIGLLTAKDSNVTGGTKQQ